MDLFGISFLACSGHFLAMSSSGRRNKAVGYVCWVFVFAVLFGGVLLFLLVCLGSKRTYKSHWGGGLPL